MQLKSLYHPISHYGDVSKCWYVIAGGKWHPVDRRYSSQELKSLWQKIEYTNNEPKPNSKQEVVRYQVEGSKGNKYEVANDSGYWTCSCPAHGFSRGADCKHIKQLKQTQL